ncbi:hypothetical protein J7I44_15415 [Frateuria sp. MAH-13]|uniref:Anti sigma-E protein RseA N-terminal domain-containing protein n=1 Tax=Frateuria flava TaxID=2821489 RepID=A0ABS4DRL2_9GAMM|nr:hypothetical protein [Frateuria flava]MBP1475699.1 hypothetical protein [Frateuria flava]
MTTPLLPQEPQKLPGEAELTALYRKLPQTEPAPALDQAVLRAAAKALADDGERAPATHAVRRPRWPVALGSAATLVLVAGLAWHMRQMPEATAPAAQAPAAMTEPSAQAPTAPVMPPPPPAPPAPAMATPRAKTMAEPAPVRPAAAARASHPPARKALALPEPRPPIRQQVAVPMPAPMPAPPAVMETAAPAPALVTPPPAPPAPPAATVADFAAENPTAELAAIRQLFAQGNDKEGSERLARFRKAHPDIALPDDLRAHLPQP